MCHLSFDLFLDNLPDFLSLSSLFDFSTRIVRQEMFEEYFAIQYVIQSPPGIVKYALRKGGFPNPTQRKPYLFPFSYTHQPRPMLIPNKKDRLMRRKSLQKRRWSITLSEGKKKRGNTKNMRTKKPREEEEMIRP